jgi:DNA-binding transcriptional MerR regulator
MERYRLTELTNITGVTQRTIRFYIAEGLLPPPEGAGPAAVYTAAHRDRLALINVLKERYLPLKEIRRRLATLTEAEIRAELQQSTAELPLTEPSIPAVSAATIDYLDSLLDSRPRNVLPADAVRAVASVREHWERITLADGVELHVRADRLREAIPLDALVRQARKLLGED